MDRLSGMIFNCKQSSQCPEDINEYLCNRIYVRSTEHDKAWQNIRFLVFERAATAVESYGQPKTKRTSYVEAF